MVDDRGLRFEQLFGAFRSPPALPALQTFTARDGSALPFRHYASDAPRDLILLHGSASHSFYLHAFAQALARANAANVYTPDLRGHGLSPARRGDIDYILQLEDDLADFIEHLRRPDSARPIVVAGHSSGGALALRFGGGRHGALASGYLLLAPYLGHDAPTVRSNAGGWAQPNLALIVPLLLLNRLGITAFNGARVLRFNVPEQYRTGTETLSYSYRMMTGFNPVNFRRELAAIKAPLAVFVGAEDEAFYADRFEPAIKSAAPHAKVQRVEGASHLGIVINEAAQRAASEWLKEAFRTQSFASTSAAARSPDRTAPSM